MSEYKQQFEQNSRLMQAAASERSKNHKWHKSNKVLGRLNEERLKILSDEYSDRTGFRKGGTVINDKVHTIIDFIWHIGAVLGDTPEYFLCSSSEYPEGILLKPSNFE